MKCDQTEWINLIRWNFAFRCFETDFKVNRIVLTIQRWWFPKQNKIFEKNESFESIRLMLNVIIKDFFYFIFFFFHIVRIEIYRIGIENILVGYEYKINILRIKFKIVLCETHCHLINDQKKMNNRWKEFEGFVTI